MIGIINFLQKGGEENKTCSSEIYLIEGELYKRGFVVPLFKCLDPI